MTMSTFHREVRVHDHVRVALFKKMRVHVHVRATSFKNYVSMIMSGPGLSLTWTTNPEIHEIQPIHGFMIYVLGLVRKNISTGSRTGLSL